MTTMVLLTLIIVGVIAFIISTYNRLILLKNRYLNAFSQIDIQLKRRHDLIPNFVNTVKAYLKHENETLESVIQARNTAVADLNKAEEHPERPELIQSIAHSQQELGSALNRLNLVVEAYPELKANENIKDLTEELASTENRIAFARQHYNDTVMEYNVVRQSFPNNIVANAFGHMSDAQLLNIEDRQAIKVSPKIDL